jgi:hypothetical protein
MTYLRQKRLTITVFVVGKDATIPEHREALRSIAAAGHEIANHSFIHEPWLGRYSVDELRAELASAEEWLERTTGQVPVGFRAPGFSISDHVARELARRGYLYDASTLPTFVGPLARRYYLSRIEAMPADELRKRQQLFGSFRDGLKPLGCYRWRLDGKDLIEVPVTTVPGMRLPFHVSYIVYLSMFSARLALAYFRTALRMCRVCRLRPSILLHPLDFLGAEDIAEPFFFPAMKMPRARKLAVVDQVLDIVAHEFATMPLRDHAQQMATLPGLRVVESRLEDDS